MKIRFWFLCAAALVMSGFQPTTSAIGKELEVIEVAFQGDKRQIDQVDTAVHADPDILGGDNPPCVEITKVKGVNSENQSHFLCRPDLKALQKFTAIYKDVVAPQQSQSLETLAMTMSPTAILDCSATKCEANDGATCKPWRRNSYNAYKCYDSNFLGNSQHECF